MITCEHGYLELECEYCSNIPYVLEKDHWDEVDWEPQEDSEYEESTWDYIDERFNYDNIVSEEYAILPEELDDPDTF